MQYLILFSLIISSSYASRRVTPSDENHQAHVRDYEAYKEKKVKVKKMREKNESKKVRVKDLEEIAE